MLSREVEENQASYRCFFLISMKNKYKQLNTKKENHNTRIKARIRVGQVRPLSMALREFSYSESLGFVPRPVTCLTLVLALPNENRNIRHI